jgi:hypothetical protein
MPGNRQGMIQAISKLGEETCHKSEMHPRQTGDLLKVFIWQMMLSETSGFLVFKVRTCQGKDLSYPAMI